MGFDVVDMPDFFAYMLSMFPAEDDYGRPKEVRGLKDPMRFGDFVRFVSAILKIFIFG